MSKIGDRRRIHITPTGLLDFGNSRSSPGAALLYWSFGDPFVVPFVFFGRCRYVFVAVLIFVCFPSRKSLKNCGEIDQNPMIDPMFHKNRFSAPCRVFMIDCFDFSHISFSLLLTLPYSRLVWVGLRSMWMDYSIRHFMMKNWRSWVVYVSFYSSMVLDERDSMVTLGTTIRWNVEMNDSTDEMGFDCNVHIYLGIIFGGSVVVRPRARGPACRHACGRSGSPIHTRKRAIRRCRLQQLPWWRSRSLTRFRNAAWRRRK